MFPLLRAFPQAKRTCTYRVKVKRKKQSPSQSSETGDDVKDEEPAPATEDPGFEWIYVCTPTRNRIIAVANLFTYARYIVQVRLEPV